MYLRDFWNLARCSLSLNISPSKVRVVSKTASPCVNPASWIDIFASLSGTISPSMYATISWTIVVASVISLSILYSPVSIGTPTELPHSVQEPS